MQKVHFKIIVYHVEHTSFSSLHVLKNLYLKAITDSDNGTHNIFSLKKKYYLQSPCVAVKKNVLFLIWTNISQRRYFFLLITLYVAEN